MKQGPPGSSASSASPHRSGTVLHTARGEFEGRIGVPPRVPSGGHGFGYDPLFLVAPGFERTSAELEPAEKNRLSHRARALNRLVESIDPPQR
jgi:XTP/dITP diphosphohydrolase